MTKDQITSYTMKITNSNKTALIVVLYEIFFTYIDEAKAALDRTDAKRSNEDYREALRRASQVIRHLEEALDFSYEISGSLFPLYDFAERQIAKAIYTKKEEDLAPAEKIMGSLMEAFSEIAKKDDSAPLMGNTEQVVAGYTYGPTDLSEATANYDSSRGFFA